MYKAQHPLGVELNKLILHKNDNNKTKCCQNHLVDAENYSKTVKQQDLYVVSFFSQTTQNI
jgi:hypothetical protein